MIPWLAIYMVGIGSMVHLITGLGWNACFGWALLVVVLGTAGGVARAFIEVVSERLSAREKAEEERRANVRDLRP